MMVTLEISHQAQRAARNASKAAGRAGDVMADAVEAAAVVGADVIAEAVVTGQVGIAQENQHPATGLASGVQGWMVDRSVPLAAIGIPSNHPAHAYGRVQAKGGTIFPKNARALAIPISKEAKRHSSPREMEDLDLIPRPGRPPLLVRQIKGGRARLEVHWVLVRSVVIPATHWLTRGVKLAAEDMMDAARDVLREYVKSWRTG